MDETMLDAGRKLDALIAERVMGLEILAHDWPCGSDPECGNYVAAGTLQIGLLEEPAFYPDRGPVMADPGGLVSAVYGPTKCPVPFYSTDIAASEQVVEAMRARGWHVAEDDRGGDPWWCEFATANYNRGGQATAPTRPLARCRAALAFVDDLP